MNKLCWAILSFISGIIFFVALYDLCLWDKVVFPQVLTEPAAGRGLNIRKNLSENHFSRQATFVFGSSLALNGINCHVLEKKGPGPFGECFNLGIPGSPFSFTDYLRDVLRLQPKNIIFIVDYDTFDPQSIGTCKASSMEILEEDKRESLLFKSGFLNYKGFLERWAYKNRLVDALVGVNESRGWGAVGKDFKNPVFVLGRNGLLADQGIDQQDALKVFNLEQTHARGAVCADGDGGLFLRAAKTIHQLSRGRTC